MTTTSQETLPFHASADRNRARASSGGLHSFIATGLYLFFAVFLIWPIVQIVNAGFTRPSGAPTFEYFFLIFRDPTLLRGLWNGAAVGVMVTLLTLVISLPLAILSVRYTFPLSRVLNGLLLVPLVLPPFVGAIGMQIVLGRYGPLTRILGGGPMGIDWIGKYRLL